MLSCVQLRDHETKPRETSLKMFETRDKMMTKSSKHVLDKGKNISQKKGKKKES